MIRNIQTEMRVSDEKWRRIFNKQIIIGFGHKARQGKDYIAKKLQEKYGGKIIKFADALYEEVSENKNIPLLAIVDIGTTYLSIREDNTGRLVDANLLPEALEFLVNRGILKYPYMKNKDSELLQIWGTNVKRRLYGDDYWINKLKERMPSDKIIYITDVRFLNEYNFIKKLSGYYIEVQRFNSDGTRFIANDRDPQHISETSLDNIVPDLTISAKSGELDSLVEQADNFISKLIPKKHG